MLFGAGVVSGRDGIAVTSSRVLGGTHRPGEQFRSAACAAPWPGCRRSRRVPGRPKTVSQWFPLRLRGHSTSVYDSGARIGSAAATPLIALIIGLFGWQAAFFFAGGLGILWAIGWWAWYRRPEFKSAVNDAELGIIHESHLEPSANNLHPTSSRCALSSFLSSATSGA